MRSFQLRWAFSRVAVTLTADTIVRRPTFSHSCVLLLLTALPALAAQPRPIRFDRLSLEQGLSQSTVFCVLQDSKGFLWLGTEQGLNRYDGYRFKVYKHDRDDPASLPDNLVWSIAEDAAGDLWVATEGGGIARWERKSGRFHRYGHREGDPRSLASDVARTLYLDRSGAVWVGTRDAGLDRLDPSTGVFTHYRHDAGNPASLSQDSVYAVLEDRSGSVWVGTNGGLNRFDAATGRFTRYLNAAADPASLSEDRIRALAEDGDGRLWIGTSNGGLNALDTATSHFVRYRRDAADPASLSHDSVRAILEDGEGRLWVGTSGGLDLLDAEGRGFIRYENDPTSPTSLADNNVMSLYQDHGGTLWVGTRSAGVHKWNPNAWSFGYQPPRPSDPKGLRNGMTTSFAEDGQGRLWIGTLGGGLNELDRATGKVRRYTSSPGDPKALNDDRVMALLRSRNGTLWVGTLNGGLSRFDPATGTFKAYRHDEKRPGSLGADGVMTIFEDRAGELWIGTYQGGLNHFDRDRERFWRFGHNPDDASSLSSDVVTSIAEGPSGTLWIGTDGGGLNLFDRRTGVFRSFRYRPGDATSLSSDVVFALHVDPSGTLWIGTRGGGLAKLVWSDPTSAPRFKTYGEREGLPNDVVYGIEPDRAGNLWLSTNNGLARFDPENERFTSFGASDGLQGPEFNFGAHKRSASGELFFGGTNGFNAFFPERLRRNERIPALALTAFFRGSKPVSGPEQLESVELAPGDSTVTFEFAALDFTAPERNRYAYKLEGFDRDWVDLGTVHRITYTNLDAGRYRLRVKGSNNDGVWNEAGLSLPVRMVPPPWKTRGAFAGYALLLAGSALAFVRGQRRSGERAAERRRGIEIQQSEARYRGIVEDQTELICRYRRDGIRTFVNEAYCRYLGKPREALLGTSLFSGLTAEDHDQVERHLDTLSPESPVGTLEHRAAGAPDCWQQWTNRAIVDAEGRFVEFQSVGRDITAERRLEEQLRQSQKMEAVGTLAGGIAHDFNNLVTAIMGYCDLLLGRLEPADPASRHLEQMRKAGESASSLVRQLLAFGRKQVLAPRVLALGDVLADVKPMLERLIGEDVELVTAADAELGNVRADASQIEQIVVNLAVNARDAMPKGGRLTIGLRNLDVSATLAGDYLGAAPGPYVILEVRDEGLGMDAATQSRIFEPFFTTKANDQGTGLGLATVYGIVKQSSGHISVISAPGQGSTFRVLLPRVEEPAALAPSLEAGVPLDAGHETVLLVEDEECMRRLAKEVLEQSGYRVLCAAAGPEAIRMAQAYRGAIDLILTDVVMPGMSGPDLVQRLSFSRPALRSVYMSGHGSDALLRHALPIADVAFLQKPFRPKALARMVRETLDAGEVSRQSPQDGAPVAVLGGRSRITGRTLPQAHE